MSRLAVSCLLALAACHTRLAALPPAACPADGPRIARVTIDGARRGDVAELAILEGTLDDPARLERVRIIALARLADRGYLRAKLAVETKAGCPRELVVHAELGTHFTINALELVGGEVLAGAVELLESRLGTANVIGGIYRADDLATALEVLFDRYRDAGWVAVTIGAAQVAVDDERGTVAIKVPIDPGPRYAYGAITSRGGDDAARADVVAALGVHTGDLYDGPRTRAGTRRARRVAAGRRLALEIVPKLVETRVDLELVLEALP